MIIVKGVLKEDSLPGCQAVIDCFSLVSPVLIRAGNFFTVQVRRCSLSLFSHECHLKLLRALEKRLNCDGFLRVKSSQVLVRLGLDECPPSFIVGIRPAQKDY